MLFALLDGLALLGHAADDSVDRLLLLRLGLLDLGAVTKIIHGKTS